jgi:spermidine synthase
MNAGISQRNAGGLLFACMLLSGACALVYEVVWLRAFDLFFGQTAGATAAVLSAYMAGLGLGAQVFGRWIDGRQTDPVKLYGWLEGGVAAYALVTPLLWRGIDAADLAFQHVFHPSGLASIAFKFAIAFLVLLPPTFLMGGTLPVTAKAIVRAPAETGRSFGLLYGANTFGGAAGVFLSGFVLLPAIGMRETVYAAAACGFLIFAVCIFRRAPIAVPEIPLPESPAAEPDSRARTQILLFMFALSGAAAMLYEVAWTRALAVALGSSVYAFSAMLGTFLLGIALGSALFGIVMAQRGRGGLGSLAALQVALGMLVLAGTNQLDGLPFRFVQLYAACKGRIAALELGKVLLCAMVILPSAILLGAVFACFIHAYRRKVGIGSRVGAAYLANTAGNILGAVLTGFLLIPLIGAQRTLIAGALLSAAIGLAVWVLRGRRVILGALVTVAIVAPAVFLLHPWDKLALTSGMAIDPGKAVGLSRAEFQERVHWKQNLFFSEGIQSVVSVDRWQDHLFLSVNGKVDASSDDAFTQLYLGHLPMLLHPRPERVLIIGLGSGMTLGAVAAYPAAQRIDCVEIEKSVIPATRFFEALNRHALDDPRVHLHIGDGRNFLREQPDLYDVIISEPSNPWMAGVANLFSREHYETAATRLRPGGIFCQWLHAYSMSPDDLRMIVNTFCGVFQHASLWTSFYPDLILIGSDQSRFDFGNVQRGFSIPHVREDMARHGGIRAPEGVFATFLLGDSDLRGLAAGARTNTDNHPDLEFSAPLHLYDDTAEENLAMIHQHRSGMPLPITGVPSGSGVWAEIARAYLARKMVPEARAALARSTEIEPGNAGWLEVSGILDAGLGNLDAASRQLDAAIATGSATSEAHFYLGLIDHAQGNDTVARRELDAALAMTPGDPAYLRAVSQMGPQ